MMQNKNDDLIIWNLDFALSTFFEIDTDLIQPLLPSKLRTVEVAPGISLFNITAFNFPAGALGSMPEFQELIFSAIVAPNLSREVPKFAMYILSLGSSCQEHLDHSADYYKLPCYNNLLHGKINKEEQSVEYSDSSGAILSLKNCSTENNFKDEERYFQAFTSKENKIYLGDLHMKASIYEHQKSGDMGVIHNHPFFRDIDMEEADPVVFMQMIGEPGKIGQQFYYRPEIFE